MSDFSIRGWVAGAGPLRPGTLVEASRLVDNGFVFAWDVSGPFSGRDAFFKEKVEFAYLATDTTPVTLFVKRSRPGVQPPLWDIAGQAPGFTLRDINEAEAAARQSADVAQSSQGNAVAASANARQSAIFAEEARDQAKYAAADARFYALQIGVLTTNWSLDSDASPSDNWSNS